MATSKKREVCKCCGSRLVIDKMIFTDVWLCFKCHGNDTYSVRNLEKKCHNEIDTFLLEINLFIKSECRKMGMSVNEFRKSRGLPPRKNI